VPLAALAPGADDTCMDQTLEGSCPVCHQGDLISITMAVSGSGLSFTTCHMCESKWWYRDGEAVPLSSVIDDVIGQHA
jgi:formate dehydrogenase maturation protein FdhE